MKKDVFLFTRKKVFYNLVLSAILSLIPFLRMLSKNSDYLSQTLWAEDGLFTLCFKKSSIINCTTDGFSGYLQLLPRLTGLIASRFDPLYWALAINVQAVAIYFIITLFLFSYLGHRDIPFSTRFLIAGAPTLLAFSGAEIIGVIANDYLLLFYVALVYITFLGANKENRRFNVSALVVFCILALSSPFGLVAGFLLTIKIFSNHGLKKNWISLATIAIANLVQIIIMISQLGKREQSLNISYLLKEIVLSTLKSIFYILYTPKTDDLLTGVQFSNLQGFMVIILIFLTIFMTRKNLSLNLKKGKISSLAIQIASFSFVLCTSVLSNGAVHRYLNLLILINILVLATICLSINPFISKRISLALTFLILLNLFSNFQVSDIRVSEPSWKREWSKTNQICLTKKIPVPITFSPLWPTVNPHTYPMFEPLTNMISCQDVNSISK
jgi:hypothetical protein